jgi:hypothetical protein
MKTPTKNTIPNSWEVRYWPNSNLAEPPKCETFSTPEEARSRREEIMALGHPAHLRLFPTTQ